MDKYEDRTKDNELADNRLVSNMDNVKVETPYILNNIENLNEVPEFFGPKKYTQKKLTREQIVEKITSDPSKTNMAWADEWGCSRERVRQLREQFGLASASDFNLEIFNLALEKISKGQGYITAHTFRDIPNFSVRKLNTWIQDKPHLKQQVELIRQEAYNKTHHPSHKLCPFCDKTLPIDNFYVSKVGRDKRMNKCNDCNIKIVKSYYDKRDVPNPTVTEKTCASVRSLGPLPASFFHKSRKSSSGLQYSSKRYMECYSRNKLKYNKIMKIEDDNIRQQELQLFGDWQQRTKNEAKELLIKDLEEYKLLNLE